MLPLLWLALIGPVLAFHTLSSPGQLHKTEFDYVIIGGGTAGLVVASRLSEDPEIKVLVVEAGKSNRGIVDIMVPFLAIILPETQVDWNFTTTPQKGLFDRTLTFPRGRGLGGSSSMNFMAYNRGSNDTWDEFARLTRDDGWDWKHVEKYYLKSSRLVPPADGHNTTGQVYPPAHGNGPLEVSVYGFPNEIDGRIAATSNQLGSRFKFNADINHGDATGTGYLQSTIGNSRRCSSAVAYLDPIRGRDNLYVLINTQATRLIQSERRHHDRRGPAFRTVEIAQGPEAPRYHVRAKREVILSAGAIGTPHVLLLSGIGNKTALCELNIEARVDLPDVGQRLADQPMAPFYYFVNSTHTIDDVFRNKTLFNQEIQEWNQTGKGLFTNPSATTITLTRLPDNATIFKTVKDPSSGKLAAHTEMLFVNGFADFGIPPPATGNFLTALPILVSPTSRGSVTLSSADPFTQPTIDPNFLTTDFDIYAMVQAMKDAERFVNAPLWRGYTGQRFGAFANVSTDEELADYARKVSVSVNHAAGTARMAPARADYGVVDPDLRLKKVSGVRIVDASVFPRPPECHPQALVYIVAERAADMIKATHR